MIFFYQNHWIITFIWDLLLKTAKQEFHVMQRDNFNGKQNFSLPSPIHTFSWLSFVLSAVWGILKCFALSISCVPLGDLYCIVWSSCDLNRKKGGKLGPCTHDVIASTAIEYQFSGRRGF